MNTAPPKPPSKNANRKAVAAYFSELRRWAQALESWEAALDQRETELAEAINEFEDDENVYVEGDDDDECNCTPELAEAGCDCPKCTMWRSNRAKQMIVRQQDAVKAGDELQWLENLYKLSDKRRRKKHKAPRADTQIRNEGLGVD